jgi:hypothetical protein
MSDHRVEKKHEEMNDVISQIGPKNRGASRNLHVRPGMRNGPPE